MKAPVYERNGGYNIAFEAYREIKPINSDDKIDIQNIPLKKPEDLLDIFNKDSKFISVVRIRGSYVDKRIILSTTVSQVLIVTESFSNDVTFEDNENYMVSMSEKANEKSEEIKELITNEVKSVPNSPKSLTKHSPKKEKVESDEESDDEEEEESEDDESDNNDD